ncbi:MAG TPA: tetratricopeptide repeat protein [Candidatus Acidoferrales bacterium]|nr:tetratricopeptide repeat protein [Candidatus Acidoferrales bacterium]
MPPAETRPAPEPAKPLEKARKENLPAPPGGTPEARRTPAPGEALPEDSSLIAKISPQTPPRRAASLRLTEEGRKLLAREDYTRALASFERSIAIDATNPYSYYYLAKTHYQQGRYQESLNFLDVAESRFAEDPYWLAETWALRGENFRALGFLQRAESSYARALKINPGSRTALQGMNRLRAGSERAPR